jgi:glycosyltransferase involved in cell wall biosynthesis
MKILVICQYYSPEPFRISDICEELVRWGNDVTVVTGTPNYPMGEIYPGYEKGKKQDEIQGGVRIHRCPTIPRKTGALFRVLNYYSYPGISGRYIRQLPDDFDLVFINQLSPVMMAKAGISYAKRHGKKSVLYCLDLWPESVTAGGISRGSFIYKVFHKESEKIYQAADRILVTSKSFSKYFRREFGIDHVEYLPQYAEDLFRPEECKKEPDDFIDLMFAGNLGVAQCVDTIIRTAAECKEIKNLRWHIVGDGVELENLKKLASQLKAPVTFYGRKPLEEMPKYYAKADAMLVTMQKDPVLAMTLPGKVQSYMAAGKPLIGAISGETPKIVSEAECGYITEAQEIRPFSQAVRKFISLSGEERQKLGTNARKYYEKYFSKKVFMRKLTACFEHLNP